MKFPSVSDIASTSVTHVDISCSIGDALDIMLEQDHRNIIVIDRDCFRLLTVIDVLNIQNNSMDLDMPLSKLDLKIIPTIHKDKNVLDTLEYLNESVEYICVVHSDNRLYGLVTNSDITSNIDPDTLMDNYKLIDFLKLGRRMKWVSRDIVTSVLLNDMIKNSFDNTIVVENMKPIGILTTKDIMKLIKQRSDLTLEISHYMSYPVDTIHKDASIKEALEFLRSKHYRRVVVVDDEGSLSGIIAQHELISLTYSKWVSLMKEYQEELHEINNLLKDKNREYEIKASTDSLTGLYNRYKFSELYLSSYSAMVQRHNEMSLLILDIDFFKRVNDTYGHNVGDNVLIKISHSLLKTLRNIDIVCRWGGEEFIALLPTASLKDAGKIAEKLRVFIENLEIETVGKVTVSIGIAQVVEGKSMQDIIDRADKALYLAKNSGRNCVKTENDILDTSKVKDS